MQHAGLDRLQREIDVAVRQNRDVYSAVLGVASANGDFHWMGAAGTAYADKTERMQVSTPIYIASITKMYVAAATMILEERGILSLDDPLSKFLPAAWLTGLHRDKGRDYSDQLRAYHLTLRTLCKESCSPAPRRWIVCRDGRGSSSHSSTGSA